VPAASNTRVAAAGDTIIDDRWTAMSGDDKESSGQAQRTNNHCALKAG